MDKTLGGQPLWVWGVGLAAVVGGYLLIFRSKKATSAGGAKSPAPMVTESFTSTITEWQGPPHKHRKRSDILEG